MKMKPPMNRRIISFDPGGSTGIAYMEKGRITAREELSIPDHYWRLYELLTKYMPDTVVFEQYEYRRDQDHSELQSPEYAGVIRLWCQEYCRPWVSQKPAVGKVTGQSVFWDPRKLKHVGLWLPNMGHAMDATGHLLHYWSFTLRQKNYLNLLKDLGDFE